MVPDQILIGSTKGVPDTARLHPLTIVPAFGAKEYGNDGTAAANKLLIFAVQGVLRLRESGYTSNWILYPNHPLKHPSRDAACRERKRAE